MKNSKDGSFILIKISVVMVALLAILNLCTDNRMAAKALFLETNAARHGELKAKARSKK